MITARNIYKEFVVDKDRSVEVLRGVDIDIFKEKINLILGPSGAGKTTLLHILAGLDRPSRGEIFWEGKDLSLLSEKEVSLWHLKRMGFVFQFFHLIPDLTLKENVLLPAILARQDLKVYNQRAEQLLDSLGLYERRKHYPAELSGGEKQRACIARAILLDPDYIFCDEPTGSLDSHNADVILNLLQTLNKEHRKTLIIVSHKKILEEIGDLVYYLYDGRIGEKSKFI